MTILQDFIFVPFSKSCWCLLDHNTGQESTMFLTSTVTEIENCLKKRLKLSHRFNTLRINISNIFTLCIEPFYADLRSAVTPCCFFFWETTATSLNTNETSKYTYELL